MKIDKKPFRRILEAQQIGRKIFGIRIPFLVDEKPAKQIEEKLTTYLEVLGDYDFRNDIIRVYEKRLNYFSKHFDVDLDSLTLFIICHELCHAKQARLCEESGFFPYRVKMSRLPIPYSIDSTTYDIRSVQVSGIGFPEIFLNGLSDFAVNKELLKHGFYDSLAAKTLRVNPPEGLSNILPQKQLLHQIIIEKLCLLPLNIDVCEHKNVDGKVKDVLEEYYLNLLGEKWHYAVDKMRQLEINKPLKNVEIAQDLLKKVFGVQSFLMPVWNRFLFDASQIPKFWSKESYNVLFLS